MKKRVWLYCCALILASVLLIWLAASPLGIAQALTGEVLTRWLAGGSSGGGISSGSGYTLSDSIGQGVAGPSSGGGYRLSAGYQVGIQEDTRWQLYLPITSKQTP